MKPGTIAKLSRIGMGWTLDTLANMSALSISYLSKVENDERPVPDIIKQILELDDGPQWYFDIVESIEEDFKEDVAQEILDRFHNAIGLKSWQF